jgi:hypothetical protein
MQDNSPGLVKPDKAADQRSQLGQSGEDPKQDANDEKWRPGPAKSLAYDGTGREKDQA